MTTPRDSVEMAAREALAARSAMGEMAEMEEAGPPLETARLWPVGLVVTAGTGVPPAAMAATAEQAVSQLPMGPIPRPSAEPVERVGLQMMEPAEMVARAGVRMRKAHLPKPSAGPVETAETE